jgi:LPXTG-site transpeptidase (sortase) family protein
MTEQEEHYVVPPEEYPEEYKFEPSTEFTGTGYRSKIIFATQVIAIFFVTFSFLYLFGFVPEEIAGGRTLPQQIAENNPQIEDTFVALTSTKPNRITIDKIGVDINIEQPTSQNVQILDEFLKKGAVYYPGSGTIENGNIFLFGHSASAFAGVINPAYKAFNDLEKLSPGEEIELTADGNIYIYSVDNVNLVDSNTAFVDFTKEGQTLTLSTCNTFGKLQDRWVVEATFKEARLI